MWCKWTRPMSIRWWWFCLSYYGALCGRWLCVCLWGCMHQLGEMCRIIDRSNGPQTDGHTSHQSSEVAMAVCCHSLYHSREREIPSTILYYSLLIIVHWKWKLELGYFVFWIKYCVILILLSIFTYLGCWNIASPQNLVTLVTQITLLHITRSL